MNSEKKTIAVIFGGRSTEHEVSCKSAYNVIAQIDHEKWDVIAIGITREGSWLLTEDTETMLNGSWTASSVHAEIGPDTEKRCVTIKGSDGASREVKLDVVWPVLHGKNGEDGTIQGLLELARIPYVGCGVLASAVSMDKFFTKIIVDRLGIRQARFVGLHDYELRKMDEVTARVEAELDYPVFIKPSNAGSSCGVSKANDAKELAEGLKKAAEVDSKILVEEFIRGHEVECAVFGGGKEKPQASGVGEILAAAEFYDYDAKYNNPDSQTVTDPVLPEGAAETVRKYACEIFNAVDGYGLSRVDFFVTDEGEVIFNEINTMPGFTAISMYPMLWEARGISKKELVERLIENAMKRWD
ncbi:MAG: D-alanine--D-alanine ligase family protein [Eubacteriales bacterium]|nr:D-alanine--D-alanine ligase family protein [Eubacteriales bacterium]